MRKRADYRIMDFTLALAWLIACSCKSTAPEGAVKVFYDKDKNALPPDRISSPDVDWPLVSGFSDEGRKMTGVGAIDNCTGFLLDTGNDKAPAYLITNGHCIHFAWLPGPDEIIQDLAATESDTHLRVSFFQFHDYLEKWLQGEMTRYPVKAIKYASMKGTDIAVMELEHTLGYFKKAGVEPLPLGSGPKAGRPVVMFGIPKVPQRQTFLRKMECRFEGETDVVEGEYVFLQALRHRCSSFSRASGSPMMHETQEGGFEVVALNNTGAWADPKSDCALDAPCERKDDGTLQPAPDMNYAVSLAGIMQCFGPTGIFDPKGAGCPLPR